MLRGLRSAIRFMTVLPVGVPSDAPSPVPWFPAVGWIFGVLGVGLASAACVIVETSLGAMLVGAAIVSAWAFLSRLLHWDGLADTSDALWGGATPLRRLEIMKDSSTGAFGTTTVVLVVLLEVIAVAAVFASGDWWAIGAAPVIGRFAATLGLAYGAPARSDGLGAALCGPIGSVGMAMAVLPVILLLVVPSWERGALLFGGVLLARILPQQLGRRVGGITGDIVGASVLMVEVFVLLGAALLGGM